MPRANGILLPTGPSGIGKSSVLRILAGVWPAGSGQVTRPEHIGTGGLMYLPQRPYLLSDASLREQVAYPSDPAEVNLTDERLHELLADVRGGGMLRVCARVCARVCVCSDCGRFVGCVSQASFSRCAFPPCTGQ